MSGATGEDDLGLSLDHRTKLKIELLICYKQDNNVDQDKFYEEVYDHFMYI